MKSLRIVITMCLLFTASAMFAQTEIQRLMTVNIPFEFSVEDHYLPAGQYVVFTVTPERSIRIASADGKPSAIVNTVPNYAEAPSTNSRLVFRRYGDDYFLAQVWTAGQNVARNPLSSRRAMQVASRGSVFQTIAITAFASH